MTLSCLSSNAAPRNLVHGSRRIHAAGFPRRGAILVGGARPSPLVTTPSGNRLFAAQQEYQYEAQVDRLMDLLVNSLYSSKEIFLRELISNASDACDKQRFLALQDPSQSETGTNLEIRIRADEAAKTIVIEDTGVGMSKTELLENLGTIASSGTKRFLEQMKEKGDTNLIGQFGVGFYSAFLVADRVTVQTKSNKDPLTYTWESSAGSHQYSITENEGGDIARGTRITLHHKDDEDAQAFASSSKLSSLIKTYSEFIDVPILLFDNKEVAVEVVDEDATKKAQEEADAAAKEAGKESEPVPQRMKTTWETTQDYVVQNDNKPLWTRSPRDVTKDEYDAFFKSTFREFLPPLDTIHFNVEGTIEFSALLGIPAMPPFDPQEVMRTGSKNIRLYVKRVFISDSFDDDLMPRYLGFVKGVVDSADLPLNVSREILQESRVVRAIRKQLIKRTLDAITTMAEDEESKDTYVTFWEAFGRNIKLGVLEDEANRPLLAKLLRFESSAGSMTSLTDYVGRKKDGQTSIYYLTADNKAAAEASPYVEQLTSKGFEVLYLMEPIDEIAMANMQQFDDMQLVDVTKEDLALGETEEEKKAFEDASKSLEPLCDMMKKVIGEDKVEKVTVSNRLTDTPAVVVASKFGWSANMERIMKAQAMADQQQAEYMKGRRSLEINPNHPIIKSLAAASDDDATADKIRLLWESALLVGGFELSNGPKAFVERIYKQML